MVGGRWLWFSLQVLGKSGITINQADNGGEEEKVVFVDESSKNNFLMEMKKPWCESGNHEKETIIPSPQSQKCGVCAAAKWAVLLWRQL